MKGALNYDANMQIVFCCVRQINVLSIYLSMFLYQSWTNLSNFVVTFNLLHLSGQVWVLQRRWLRQGQDRPQDGGRRGEERRPQARDGFLKTDFNN